MKKTLLSLGLILSLMSVTQAQNPPSAGPVTNSLQDQFSKLNSKSNNYREGNRAFKVIEVSQLNAFWNGVLGTVKNHEAELLKGGKNTHAALEQANATIAAQTQQIAALKKDNALKDKAVQQNAYEVDNIFVLGVGINKQFFLILSLALITGLVILAIVIMSLYKKSKKVTDEKIQAFREIDQEFNDYKKAARERELKIKRELQTEMNSKEEMRQKLALLQK
ncbi:hypothetical protein I5M27_12085 [Adhaeribacter sp. BT258]|uniref:Uncharacterized protein n=1 Tax=Adhaeribacter terrigena TaxID=2793070 RepID=A0ABS1C5B5_9BACT|nr:hypothetical protein [Adhaeribacter terrigena]MBK0403730.1 hypothetical protein [Adhaeribacter terrigena]